MVIRELKPSQRVEGRWLAVLEDGSLWVTAGLAGSFTLAEDYQDLEVTVIQL